MSIRKVDVLEVVSRYAAGFFPLYDIRGRFYWEKLSVRAVVPIDGNAVKKAERMAKRSRDQFEIRYTTAVDQVIANLQREDIKEQSWVKEEVVNIYRDLRRAGVLQTVEAWSGGQLMGGLLGIVMPGTFIAETMYGIVPEASKVCLCQLVQDCAAAGFSMIDVQTPHDVDEFGLPRKREGETAHPCIRLGEVRVGVEVFMRAFEVAWRRSFRGGVAEWLEVSRGGKLDLLSETDMRNAQRFLAHTRPPAAQ
ncbi:MAG TPA: GNAT family N-acetyltransferase [Phycisphaerae bacterium]|jgi:leucyl/phenylalanyl-tRNA--protein transferase|nr:GNAT family N-acetyltransferase [Phycisphaerae bacterium]